MACRRFAGGWRHKKRVERHRRNPRFLQPRLQRRCIRERADDGQQQVVNCRIPIEALGSHHHINAAVQVDADFDDIAAHPREIRNPMRGVELHIVGQRENQ